MYKNKKLKICKVKTKLVILLAPYNGYRGFSPGVKWLVSVVSSNPHLVKKSRMNGAIPLLPLHAFMAWAGQTLPFIECKVKLFLWMW
jgi:hypothetical protein